MSKKKTTEQFIEDAKLVHGNKYDYSKVEYVNARTKVCIICHTHGEFWQTPNDHLSGYGCKKCAMDNLSLNKPKNVKEFIIQANFVQNNKYDYSKVKYVNSKTKVCIICPIHGEFWQTPNDHLNGHGCQDCYNERRYLNCLSTNEEFIDKAKMVHANKYDYSKVEYLGNKIKVCIICPKHGEFWQTPHEHLNGCGCQKCSISRLENEIMNFFNSNFIKYEYEYRDSWLKSLELDFYIPQYKVGIECQGIQHFKEIEFFGGKKHFEYVKQLDIKKKQLCEENGVKLLYYSNLGIEYPYEVFEDKDKLLEEILKYGNS